jgi:hypothetical protein
VDAVVVDLHSSHAKPPDAEAERHQQHTSVGLGSAGSGAESAMVSLVYEAMVVTFYASSLSGMRLYFARGSGSLGA